MSTTEKSCVVVEYGDGTVATNGPYDAHEQAIRAAREIGKALARDDDRRYTETPDGATIGTDGEDTIDVYAIVMGTPLDA